MPWRQGWVRGERTAPPPQGGRGFAGGGHSGRPWNVGRVLPAGKEEQAYETLMSRGSRLMLTSESTGDHK